MPEEKLNLFELASGLMTEPCACTSKIMRSNLSKAALRRRSLDNAPDYLRAKSVFRDPATLVDCPKDCAFGNLSSGEPDLNGVTDPLWNRGRPDMTSFAHQIGEHPMLFPLLQVMQTDCC